MKSEQLKTFCSRGDYHLTGASTAESVFNTEDASC